MTSNPPDIAPAAGVCKRPGCGNTLPAQDRGRARQFCSGCVSLIGMNIC